MKRCTCLIFLLVAAPALATTRVALVATGTGKVADQTITLATAAMSASKDLELLDRQSIGAVLSEQKLSLSGMVDPQRMIAVGQLLKADLFAVVDCEPGSSEAMGLVVFDAHSGLRLADQAIDAAPEKAADQIAAMTEGAAVKDRALAHGVRLVSVFPVRNADLPSDRDTLCNAVGMLLQRELANSPGIAVLDRSNLEQVNIERALPGEKAAGDLAKTAVIARLEIGRGSEGRGLRATGTLADRTNAVLAKLQVDVKSESEGDLADKLCKQIVVALNAPPAARTIDRAGEANRFARESHVLLHNGRIAEGAQAAEAAYALQPTDKNALILATALWSRAWQILTPSDANPEDIETGEFGAMTPSDADLAASLAAADRALSLERATLDAQLAAPHEHKWFLDYTGGEQLVTMLNSTCCRFDAVQNIKPDMAATLAEFRAAAMTYVFAYFDGWGKVVVNNAGDLQNYDAEMIYAMDTAASIAPSMAEFIPARDHLFHQWITAYDKSWKHPKDNWIEDDQSELMTRVLNAEDIGNSHWKDYSAQAYHRSLAKIATDLQNATNPAMRVYGQIATALCDPAGTESASVTNRNLRRLLTTVRVGVRRGGPFISRTRRDIYIAAADGIKTLFTQSNSATRASMELLRIALRLRQLVPVEVQKQIWDDLDFDPSGPPPRALMDVMQQTVEISQQPNVHVLDRDASGLRQELLREIHELNKQFPALGAEHMAKEWDSATRLVDARTLAGVDQLEECAKVDGGEVYFVASGLDNQGNSYIQAFEVPLAGGAVRQLGGKVTLRDVEDEVSAGPLPLTYPDGDQEHLILSSDLDAQNYYVAVDGQGIATFPRDGHKAFWIDSKHGLPSDNADFVTVLDRAVYIACSSHEGAYLVKWNPADHSSKVLVSSVRREAQSPLDDTAGLRIEMMVADAARHRLMLGVAELSPTLKNSWEQDHGGIWEFDDDSGTFKHRVVEESEQGFGVLRGIDANVLYAANTIWVLRYDLTHDGCAYFNFKPGTIGPDCIRNLKVTGQTIKGSVWTEPDFEQPGARRVIANWLWTGEPFERISADGKTVEMLDSKLLPSVDPLGSVSIIQPAGAGQLLLGDARQLFVVKLRSGN